MLIITKMASFLEIPDIETEVSSVSANESQSEIRSNQPRRRKAAETWSQLCLKGRRDFINSMGYANNTYYGTIVPGID